ncbi:MAG: ATP-binding cassette domain-containing protein [Coriobacteriia bacterium]|nr:ATP-binding cassette domain-containing protein [Coriobacteriia bacterium]
MTELLRVAGISFRYDDRYLALNKVSASFQAGELVAVLGSNGAGKSTFFLCLNGVLQPQEGSIYLHGDELGKSKKDVSRQRQAVGLVFQDPDSQIIAGSVESEVSFGPMNLGLSLDQVKAQVDESLAQMNIENYRDYAPQYLSGGEKKRVSIADILAMRPEVILLDEPTASLDPKNALALEEVLLTLSKLGIAIVISTHDVDFAYRIAKRAIVFSQGEILADAPVEEVFAMTETLVQAGLKKPLLYEAWDSISDKLDCSNDIPRPKTIAEFQALVDSVLNCP